MTESDDKRRVAAGVLARLYDMGISAQVIAVFLDVSRMTVHRWIVSGTGGFFILPLKFCRAIEEFAFLVGEVRQNWLDIITSYNGRYHAATQASLYKASPLRILKSKLNFGEKASKLTSMTFSEWAKKGKK